MIPDAIARVLRFFSLHVILKDLIDRVCHCFIWKLFKGPTYKHNVTDVDIELDLTLLYIVTDTNELRASKTGLIYTNSLAERDKKERERYQ